MNIMRFNILINNISFLLSPSLLEDAAAVVILLRIRERKEEWMEESLSSHLSLTLFPISLSFTLKKSNGNINE